MQATAINVPDVSLFLSYANNLPHATSGGQLCQIEDSCNRLIVKDIHKAGSVLGSGRDKLTGLALE